MFRQKDQKTERQKDKKTKRQKDKNTKRSKKSRSQGVKKTKDYKKKFEKDEYIKNKQIPKRVFNIVTSGQFRTLAMFYYQE